MIPVEMLDNLAKERLADAEILFSKERYGGALYLCGYAVELALKARACKTLDWEGLQEKEKDFSLFKILFTHDLNALLRLTGFEKSIEVIAKLLETTNLM